MTTDEALNFADRCDARAVKQGSGQAYKAMNRTMLLESAAYLAEQVLVTHQDLGRYVAFNSAMQALKKHIEGGGTDG